MENELTTQDLLTEENNFLFEYEYATHMQRLLNFLIDNVVMRFTITYITAYGIGFILGYFFPDFMRKFINQRNFGTEFSLTYIIAIFNYLIYYTLLEKLLKGRTIGKFITKTRAVKNNGEELTFKNAFLRSICRLIPFEIFTCFGTPLHDSLSNTMVIKTK